jgi:hypothetical protein
MSNNEPLWKLMYLAASSAPRSDDWSQHVRNTAAAELRAIVQELENNQSFLVDGHNLSTEGKRIAAWLDAEADRAEQSNA